MILADIGRFYKNMMKGNYGFGRRASNKLTRNMSPGKARATGTVIDVAAGAGLTYLFGMQTLSCVAAIGFAIASLVTAPVTLPAVGAVAAAVGINLLFGSLSGLMTAIGVGFLADAKEKLGIPSPRTAFAGVGHAAYTATKPVRWTAHKLRHPFSKAHDGNKNQKKGPPDDYRPKPGKYKI